MTDTLIKTSTHRDGTIVSTVVPSDHPEAAIKTTEYVHVEPEIREIDSDGLKMNVHPLECDKCKKRIGWVHEYDLDESYFFCEDCAKPNATTQEKQ